MNEKIKDIEENLKDKAETKTNDTNESTWARDQEAHSYYYDDSANYEIYNPEDDDEDEEKNLSD